MKNMFKLSFAALALAVALPSFAQVGLRLGQPGVMGTGCQPGTVVSVLSPDDTQLSILFSDYVAKAGPGTGFTRDRRNCEVSVPLIVPNGYSVSIVGVDYTGYVGLPRGASAEFTARYFFAGRPGARPVLRRFSGAQSTNYVIENDLQVTAETWSPCGAQAILRIPTSMVVNNPFMTEDAIATLDSIDMTSGVIFQFQYRRCH